MALLIKETVSKKIKIQNTNTEIPQLYGRIEYAVRQNGKSIMVVIHQYADKSFYLLEKEFSTDAPLALESIELSVSDTPSITVVHDYSKIALEEMGYEIEIVDL